MTRGSPLVTLVALLMIGATGCATAPRWRATRSPDVLDAAALLGADASGGLRGERPEEVPIVPVRRRLRPCCGFGSSLRVRVGAVNIPGVSIANIRSPDDIGRHTYDAGRNAQDQIIGSERNGLVYTCRGGFIDTAHVRDYADWTLYFATRFGRHLEEGTRITLPDDEGGRRTIVLAPIDPDLIAAVGRREVSSALAVWAAFQLSIWHEIATWYGWSSLTLFPERASAFSPEDLYSNLLGAKLASAIVNAGNDISEPLWNEAMDAWLSQSLSFLGAVDASVGEDAMAAVDGVWWDSNVRLPDPKLVLRRHFELGLDQRPWVVPASLRPPSVADACRDAGGAHPLRNPVRLYDLTFSDVIRLEIEFDERLAATPALSAYTGHVDDRDFPDLIEAIRLAARAEFGDEVDRVGGGP